MGNQERQDGFSNNNNYSEGWKNNQNNFFLGGNKIMIHPISKVLSKNKNNQLSFGS